MWTTGLDAQAVDRDDMGYLILAAWFVIPTTLYVLYLFVVRRWAGVDKDSSDQPPSA